jgi:hypothetical protein
MEGSLVDTTAEVVLANLGQTGIILTREPDSETGFRELAIKNAIL